MPILIRGVTMKFWILLIGCYAKNISFAGEMILRDMYCDDTKTITEALRETYQEFPLVMGKANDEVGSLMTVWINHDASTWTIVATNKDYSCIVGVGEKLQVINYNRKKI